MRIETEYIAQAIDPRTKVVKYQSAAKEEKDLVNWFKLHTIRGKFAGLECKIEKRYLLNGKPIVFHVEQKHILWILVAVQFAFIWWKLSQ